MDFLKILGVGRKMVLEWQAVHETVMNGRFVQNAGIS
jgi:hypothetical protein